MPYQLARVAPQHPKRADPTLRPLCLGTLDCHCGFIYLILFKNLYFSQQAVLPRQTVLDKQVVGDIVTLVGLSESNHVVRRE